MPSPSTASPKPLAAHRLGAQNGGEDVKKTVTMLNEAVVPLEDVVGGGEPIVRLPAPGQGAVAPGLRRCRAELLGAQGRCLHWRDQVASPSCFDVSWFSCVVDAEE